MDFSNTVTHRPQNDNPALHGFQRTYSALHLELIEDKTPALMPYSFSHPSDKTQICPTPQDEVLSGMNWAPCQSATQAYWSHCDGLLGMGVPEQSPGSCVVLARKAKLEIQLPE